MSNKPAAVRDLAEPRRNDAQRCLHKQHRDSERPGHETAAIYHKGVHAMVHLPFEDRIEAGRALADELAARRLGEHVIILALTRGGVPVGFSVADRLRLPLEVVVARKIGVPWQPELAMGAIAGSVLILDEPMIRQLQLSDEDVEAVVAREQEEMKRREELYRGGRPALDLEGKTVVIVDDGLATGSTMTAAARYVRELRPCRVIIGVPVGSGEACLRLRNEADDVVCVATPERFFAVGEWYRSFRQVSDSEVARLLSENRLRLQGYTAPRSAA